MISLTLNGAYSDLQLFAQDKSQASKVHCGGLPCKNLMAMDLTEGGGKKKHLRLFINQEFQQGGFSCLDSGKCTDERYCAETVSAQTEKALQM